MKKVYALILAMIYLVFTTGVAIDTSYAEEDIYASVLSASDNSEISLENESVEKDGTVVKAHAHHTAPVGKIKMPRVSATTQRVFSFSPVHHALFTSVRFSKNTVANLSANLYIRNCVLLI
ncbi:hypothetical protein SAMN05421788_1011146 [Filimonas lacunae]|uniref:Uncharacterized protein n=1 Tax=Filimonas lacunae TaxID=477680 RepID=A0A173MQQ7_9BACT|nr:hypothetical protein [Filimonas lacunae]BAV09711.1 hypothetical protein FLA_5764 [Filimonas lacunae]SIS77665.1 hypothetical protein SAMN05421788_1011146 [Filimonas lacunae]